MNRKRDYINDVKPGVKDDGEHMGKTVGNGRGQR